MRIILAFIPIDLVTNLRLSKVFYNFFCSLVRSKTENQFLDVDEL